MVEDINALKAVRELDRGSIVVVTSKITIKPSRIKGALGAKPIYLDVGKLLYLKSKFFSDGSGTAVLDLSQRPFKYLQLQLEDATRVALASPDEIAEHSIAVYISQTSLAPVGTSLIAQTDMVIGHISGKSIKAGTGFLIERKVSDFFSVSYTEDDLLKNSEIMHWMLPDFVLNDKVASQNSTVFKVKEARAKLKLTQDQLGKLLDTDGQTVRRMELSPDAKTFRKPAPRMVRLIEAYLSGYRPLDWPL